MQLNNRYLVYMYFFIICLGLLWSQSYSISGKVLNFESEDSISDVNIFIQNSDFITKTNNDGGFYLFINNYSDKSVDLNFEMIGYENKIIHIDLVDSQINLNAIYLKSKSIDLESVHIHSHQHNESQISDILLSGQKLNENRTGNLATTLANQPNIGVNSFGNTTSKPVLRGYSGDRFLLTKDGNKIGDLSQTSIDHAIALDMTEVDEIEVIRGPKSLIYGSNTIGGVIKTSLNGNPKLRVDKFYKKIFMGSESFNKSLYGNILFYIPIKDNQINVLLSNSNADNQTSSSKELENTSNETSNYKLGFTKYYKSSYINFVFENFNMNYGLPPSFEGHINGVDIELIKNAFQINYHRDISFNNFHLIDIKYNFVDYVHKEFESDLNYFSVALSKYTNSLKMELQSYHSIIGSEVSYEQFLPEGFYWTPPTDQLDISIYGYFDKIFKDFTMLASFRFGHLMVLPNQETLTYANIDSEDIKDRYFSYFSSSIGIRKIFKKFELNTWLMNTMKAPQLEELYSDGPHLGSYAYEIGEPNLELEKIYGIESSISYSDEGFRSSIVSFYNYSPYYFQMNKIGNCDEEFIPGESHPCAGEDFIEWGSGSTGWLYKYKTKGIKSLIKGLEFNLSYSIKNVNISYDFSLVRGDDLTNNIPLSYITPDKQVLNIEYSKNKISYKLRFANIYSQDRLGEFETVTPSSFLIDFILGYNGNNNKITIQINNILDEEHFNHLSKIKSIMPESGRNLNISYTRFF
tara:strand:- start:4595 stop:6838 length:2244 start_codon:yes stop_codon:yes gene_type:complete